jgi:hypothetical protein
MIGLVSATTPSLSEQKPNTCIDLPQTCSNCSFINITTVQYPNGSIINLNKAMTKITSSSYKYNFCLNNQLGSYFVNTYSDDAIVNAQYEVPVTSSMFFVILILTLAIIFFIATLIVDEEFFVYISGVLFIVSGIYILINGFSNMSDMYTRAIAYVCLGLGFIFTIGAYVYNSYSGRTESDD